MKKFIGTALVLCCLALPLAGCEDAISTVTSTTMSELEDIPNQILATPESAEMKPEYNYIHFRYDNIWTVSALVSYEIVDNGQNIKFEIGDSRYRDKIFYTSMSNVDSYTETITLIMARTTPSIQGMLRNLERVVSKMDIKFIDGNIFSRLSASKPTYICQQVNCKGVMGAGLAMQIRSQWPVVYQRYLEFCYGNNDNKLGTYQEVLVEPKLYVVNLFGQNGYGRGERQTNYAALAAALFSFFRDCAQKNQSAIVRLPYGLGCGLAGGDWDTVLDIISDAAKAWNLNVEIWELQK